MDGQKVWSNLISSFKLKVSPSVFKTWFAGAYVVDFKKNPENDLLIVGVKNTFVKEQIEKRYLQILLQIAKEKDILNLGIIIIVSQKEIADRGQKPIFSGVAQNVLVESGKNSRLGQSYNFDNFVVGASNNLAYFAAQQVTSNLGTTYNPLLFYGPSGVGKTHLLQAVGNEVSKKIADAKILYVNAEKFTNDYIDSLRNKTQESFRFKYRSLDLLLIDDIQFLAGKESTQDEFFHTFNELQLRGRQVVTASDRHPRELGRLKERLVSRLLGGMAANINLPDLEMKIAILRAKCVEKSINVDAEIIEYLSTTCRGGARELEGLLTSVAAQIKLSGGSITLGEIKNSLSVDKFKDHSKPSVNKIINAVCAHFKISSVDLCGSSRKAKLVTARQMTMYLLRRELGLPLEAIGHLIGGRDHSTVIYSVEKFQGEIAINQFKNDEVLRVTSVINKNT